MFTEYVTRVHSAPVVEKNTVGTRIIGVGQIRSEDVRI
jgi:hypothetical protein